MSTFAAVARLFERRNRFVARAEDKKAALAEFKRRVHEELLYERQMAACGFEAHEINAEGAYWHEGQQGWRRRGQSLDIPTEVEA